jgi:hypothetical protein
VSGLRSALVIVLVAGGAMTAGAGDLPLRVELTGAYASTSYSGDSTWGWFNPSKYGTWQPIEHDGFELASARLVWEHPTFPFMLDGEWSPKLEAFGSVPATADGPAYEDHVEVDLEVYDLALGQHYGDEGRARITPWFGATYMRLNEDRDRVVEGGDPAAPDASSAESQLWGVMGRRRDSARARLARHRQCRGALGARRPRRDNRDHRSRSRRHAV